MKNRCRNSDEYESESLKNVLNYSGSSLHDQSSSSSTSQFIEREFFDWNEVIEKHFCQSQQSTNYSMVPSLSPKRSGERKPLPVPKKTLEASFRSFFRPYNLDSRINNKSISEEHLQLSTFCYRNYARRVFLQRCSGSGLLFLREGMWFKGEMNQGQIFNCILEVYRNIFAGIKRTCKDECKGYWSRNVCFKCFSHFKIFNNFTQVVTST